MPPNESNNGRATEKRFDFIISLLDVENHWMLEIRAPRRALRNATAWRSARSSATYLFLVYFSLFLVDEMTPAILLPARLVRYGAEWFFFSVADGFDAISGYSSLNQRILHRVCTVSSQCKVIFRGAAFVRMAFDRDVNIGMLLQELSIGLQRALLAATNIVLVVIEVDVLHIL